MARPKKGYDARVEVRITPAKKHLWESLLWGPDDTLSAFLRRAGDLYEQMIISGQVAKSPPLGPPPSPPGTRTGETPAVYAAVPKKQSRAKKRSRR